MEQRPAGGLVLEPSRAVFRRGAVDDAPEAPGRFPPEVVALVLPVRDPQVLAAAPSRRQRPHGHEYHPVPIRREGCAEFVVLAVDRRTEIDGSLPGILEAVPLGHPDVEVGLTALGAWPV